MAQKVYTPIHMIQRAEVLNHMDSGNNLFNTGTQTKTELTEFLNWFIGNDFMKQRYQGPYYDINQDFINTWKNAFRNVPYQNVRTEMRDIGVIPGIIDLWKYYKQAYRFDPEFTDELLKTDSVKIPVSIFERLPYPCYYIDMEHDNRFAPFIGFFVYVHTDKDTKIPDIAILRITKPVPGEEDEVVHSAYFNSEILLKSNMLYHDETGFYVQFQTNHEPVHATRSVLTLNPLNNQGQYDFEETNLYDFILFILQTMLYLSSREPDVQPTKRPVHRNKPKSHKPSNQNTSDATDVPDELNVSDVGVRYGNTIRIRKQEIRKQESKQRTTSEPASTKTRTVTSHMRAAHWHHYWTGPGRTTLTVKWIPPVFVCGGKELPVTIHKVI